MNDTERQQVVDALAAVNPLYYEDAADALDQTIDRIANQRAADALREAAEGLEAEAAERTQNAPHVVGERSGLGMAVARLRARADALTDKATP